VITRCWRRHGSPDSQATRAGAHRCHFRAGLDLIARLVAAGIRESDIALCVGWSPRTFRSRKRADMRIVEALQRGRTASKPFL
jgi:hypothetical protein